MEDLVTHDPELILQGIHGSSQAFHILVRSTPKASALNMAVTDLHTDEKKAAESENCQRRCDDFQ